MVSAPNNPPQDSTSGQDSPARRSAQESDKGEDIERQSRETGEQQQPRRGIGKPESNQQAGIEPTWPVDKDFLQKNIERSVDFRKEYYKYSLGIATALLAFTVSFPPNLIKVSAPFLIFLAWAGLGVAVIAGVLAHDLWSRFFISYRNFDNHGDPEGGERYRKNVTRWRRLADRAQLYGLAVGVACIVIFAGVNLRNVTPKEIKTPVLPQLAPTQSVPPAAAPTQPAPQPK
jgi:hypothetical protein